MSSIIGCAEPLEVLGDGMEETAMGSELARKACVPCRKDSQPLTDEEIQTLLAQLPDWDLVREDGMEKLRRVYSFKNFRQALAFANRVGELAEEENHHPSLLTEWGKLTVTWWTHSIGGLFINDFIMAARTDAVFDRQTRAQ